MPAISTAPPDRPSTRSRSRRSPPPTWPTSARWRSRSDADHGDACPTPTWAWPVAKDVVPLVFGQRRRAAAFTTGSRSGLTNYQDTWWNPAESGWGLFVVHQDNTLFSALTTYDFAGSNLWLVSDGIAAARRVVPGRPLPDQRPGVQRAAVRADHGCQPRQGRHDAARVFRRHQRDARLHGEWRPVSKSITRPSSRPRPACSSPTWRPAAVTDGATLYANNCASATDARELDQGRRDADADQGAIAGNVGGMAPVVAATAAAGDRGGWRRRPPPDR